VSNNDGINKLECFQTYQIFSNKATLRVGSLPYLQIFDPAEKYYKVQIL